MLSQKGIFCQSPESCGQQKWAEQKPGGFGVFLLPVQGCTSPTRAARGASGCCCWGAGMCKPCAGCGGCSRCWGTCASGTAFLALTLLLGLQGSLCETVVYVSSLNPFSISPVTAALRVSHFAACALEQRSWHKLPGTGRAWDSPQLSPPPRYSHSQHSPHVPKQSLCQVPSR